MFKRFALGLVLVTIALGIVFIGLNILDIDEDYKNKNDCYQEPKSFHHHYFPIIGCFEFEEKTYQSKAIPSTYSRMTLNVGSGGGAQPNLCFHPLPHPTAREVFPQAAVR